MNHGGKREGAGRPLTGRKKVQLYITDDEKCKVLEFISSYRKKCEANGEAHKKESGTDSI